MIVKASGLGSARNGIITLRPYVYNGSGVDELDPPRPRTGRPRRGRKSAGARRVLAVLASLGGQATTPEIRAAMELDGGRLYNPAYASQVLARLARANPPEVTRCGRERDSIGHPARWELGPGGESG